MSRIAVIMGAGPGTGAALARALAPTHSLLLLSRSLPGSLPALNLGDIDTSRLLAASSDGSADSLAKAFSEMKTKWPEGRVDVGIYNTTGKWAPGSVLDAKVEDLVANLQAGVIGMFNFSQLILPLMLSSSRSAGSAAAETHPTLIVTGATMSLRSGAIFSTMAPSMFARRALAQSLAREFGPKGVHVAHVIVDGMIETDRVKGISGNADDGSRLIPDDIAKTYLALISQPKSCWTQELDIRPSAEKW